MIARADTLVKVRKVIVFNKNEAAWDDIDGVGIQCCLETDGQTKKSENEIFYRQTNKIKKAPVKRKGTQKCNVQQRDSCPFPVLFGRRHVMATF